MAPIIGGPWKAQLKSLADNWDSYGGKPITDEAIATVSHFHTVPTSAGGIQLEIHQDGFDIEIEISREGKIVSAFIGCEKS